LIHDEDLADSGKAGRRTRFLGGHGISPYSTDYPGTPFLMGY
jgi:hypothetical protein